MALPASSRWHRFGSFELQLDERRLLKGELAVALRPRAFDLLVALVDQAGHLVTKDELLDKVWPKMVVEEAALHVQISALRKILGADAIATVSGRGYRFTLPVTKDEVGASQIPPKHNLPYQLTSFVGREREIGQLEDLLATHRLVTLTGAGGCGKTRLAIEAAGQARGEFADGVWLVELAPLSDAQLVSQAVMQALGLKEQPGKSLTEVVSGYLTSKKLLLVIDNAEHVLDGCVPLIDEVLRRSAAVAVLVTSRERLGMLGELTYRVPSLSVPEPSVAATPEIMLTYESVRLFVDRARLQRPHFKVTAENASTLASICSRLDGIPLAIELAAPRLRSMSVEEVSQRLDQRFALLTDGSRAAPPRHRTLRSMIDWSHDLLTEVEQAMLRRVAVFGGGWTPASAESVCSGDGIDTRDVLALLTSLADKSLIIVDEHDGATRHRMLETVREYALDRLRESGDEPECRRRHFAAFLALAEAAFAKLQGPEQRLWLTRLADEHDNLRAALAWSVASSVEDGLGLAASLADFWKIHGPLREGREWCSRMLEVAPTQASRRNRARLLNVAAGLALLQSDYAAAERMELESLDLCRDIDEPKGAAYAMCTLALIALEQENYADAEGRAREGVAIARAMDDRLLLTVNLHFLGAAVQARGDWAGAHDLFNEALTIARDINNPSRIGDLLNGLGRMECEAGHYDVAAKYFKEAIAILHELDFQSGIFEALEGFGTLALATGSTLRAVRLWGCVRALRHEIGAAMRPAIQRRYDGEVDSAKAQLSRDAFDRASHEGRAMTLDEAVGYALEGSIASPGPTP